LSTENSADSSFEKSQFLEKNKTTILEWTKLNKSRIVESRKNYSWADKEPRVCLAERDQITESIKFSQSQNDGGIDLKTLDMIMKWGGFSEFPLRDEQKVLTITRKVFRLLEENKVSEAVNELLAIDGVEIVQASKIISLFDQNRFCSFDNNVANALKTLQFNEKPVLKCPIGPKKPQDICSDERWGENYLHLIWTLEVIQEYLNKEGHPLSIADIEMALFMMGK
jgi:hypothetical protein